MGKDLAAHYLDCVGLANAGKWDDVKTRCVAAGFTSHLMDGPEIKGVDMLVEWAKNTQAAFPDIKTEPQLVIVDGRNIFAIELTTGTHRGPLKTPQGEVPATNNKLGLLFFHKLAIGDDDKMTEEWAYKDARTFLVQLSMIPKEAGPARAPIDKGWDGAPIVVVAADDAASKANVEVVKKMIDALNAHRAADTAALVTDDVVESDQAEDKDRSKAESIQGADEFGKAFPDGKLDVPAYFAAGDYVVAPGTMTGTNDGPLGPMKPTHKKIASHYAEVYKLKDGKIAAIWRFRNGMATAQQLGLVPDHK
jgi:predicted ester cyclase